MPLGIKWFEKIAVYQKDILFINNLPSLFNFLLLVFLMRQISASSVEDTSGSINGAHHPCGERL